MGGSKFPKLRGGNVLGLAFQSPLQYYGGRGLQQQVRIHTTTLQCYGLRVLCACSGSSGPEIMSPSETRYDSSEDLLFRDIAFNEIRDPSVMRVHLKASKTDPFRTGVDVYVGKIGNDLCPITVIVQYLAKRGGGDGPLFVYRNGKFLTRESLVACIRDALGSVGVDVSRYSGHSFSRSGAATTALQAGVSDTTIQMLGWWRSDTYKRYIQGNS